uniref:Uncharacterized protein n=1 Tax=Amphimedon queenslandica TaxID=400682 RepID=A0A1X7TR64_AMPQE
MPHPPFLPPKVMNIVTKVMLLPVSHFQSRTGGRGGGGGGGGPPWPPPAATGGGGGRPWPTSVSGSAGTSIITTKKK